ncbi:hypothetical protein CYMTET_31529 [Cymbomonas tetramitiformis]|uniref:CSC1/OSCA1-like 7TM region domain-containing protein n=1 Tax=Cymbomonas tetramitiformis TaxID=36881 RepID=A0AAE0FGK7_9CHLO|nr:hypothetical protein CYMTET_31529 [Cymbomonas tetramitiformis]
MKALARIEQEKISETRPLALGMMTPTAFVTFSTLWAATVASEVKADLQNQDRWRSHPAPHPDDVYWPNLKLSSWEVKLRRSVMYPVMYFVMLLYSPCISILEQARVQALDPAVGDYFDTKILTQYTTLIVIGLFAPHLFRMLVTFTGEVANSIIDSVAFNMYYQFQMVVIVLAALVATQVDTVREIVDDPSEATTDIAQSIARQHRYFGGFVFARAFVELPLSLINIPVLIKNYIQVTMGRNITQKLKAITPMPFFWFYHMASLQMVFSVGLYYSTIAPLICPIVTLYFTMATIMWRYKLLYVNERRYESGGRFWPRIVNLMILSLLVYQFILIVVMGLKVATDSPRGSNAALLVLLPLPVWTLSFKASMGKKLQAAIGSMGLSSARDQDLSHEVICTWKKQESMPDFSEVRQIFSSPNLVSGEDWVIPLLHEVAELKTPYCDNRSGSTASTPRSIDRLKSMTGVLDKETPPYSTRDTRSKSVPAALKIFTPVATPASLSASSSLAQNHRRDVRMNPLFKTLEMTPFSPLGPKSPTEATVSDKGLECSALHMETAASEERIKPIATSQSKDTDSEQ